jgi:hypothetical protein
MSDEEHLVGEGGHGADIANNRAEVDKLLLAIELRLSGLSLPTPSRGGVLGRLTRGLKRSTSVYWKNHGVVVSNASLAKYRGASLPVETPMADLVVMALEEIHREVEPCSRALKRYLFGRLAQALNQEKPKSPEAIVVCLANATKLAMQAPECPSLSPGQ